MAVHLDPDDDLARGVANRLLDGAPGVSLVGPRDRLDTLLGRLLEALDHRQLLPVTVPAASATPESLRDTVEHAHSSRAAPDTALLLIVPDAGRLSSALLRELELAAEAALWPGGLKLLLASTAQLRPMLRDAGLANLYECLAAEMVVVPGTPTDDAHVPDSPPDAMAEAPVIPRPGPMAATDNRRALVDRESTMSRPRGAGRVMLPLLILAALLLAGLVALERNRRHHDEVIQARHDAAEPSPPPVSPRVAATPDAPVVVAPAPTVSAPPPPSLMPAPPPLPVVPATPAGPAPEAAAGATNLLLMAQPGDTLPVLYAKVYAGGPPPPYASVVALNPVVAPGTRLIFPPPPGGWHSRP